MFFQDTAKHDAPHIHAEYQGLHAVYSIPEGTVLAGGLPSNKNTLVIAWIEIHQEALLAKPGTRSSWTESIRHKRTGSMKIIDVKANPDTTLSVIADNGYTGTFDVKPYSQV